MFRTLDGMREVLRQEVQVPFESKTSAVPVTIDSRRHSVDA